MSDIQQAVAEIKKEYDVGDDGIINSPGKFEGEPVWAVYFYDLAGSGEELLTNQEGNSYEIFEVDDEERKEFGLADDIKAVVLKHTDQGFIYTAAMTSRELNDLRNEVQNDITHICNYCGSESDEECLETDRGDRICLDCAPDHLKDLSNTYNDIELKELLNLDPAPDEED